MRFITAYDNDCTFCDQKAQITLSGHIVEFDIWLDLQNESADSITVENERINSADARDGDNYLSASPKPQNSDLQPDLGPIDFTPELGKEK